MAAKIEIGNEVWNALKRQCAATKENSPEWDKVSKLVMVGKDDIAAALEAVAPALIREGMLRAADLAEGSHGSRNTIYEKSRRDAASAIRSAAKEV